jgi:hypothetical protein
VLQHGAWKRKLAKIAGTEFEAYHLTNILLPSFLKQKKKYFSRMLIMKGNIRMTLLVYVAWP